MSRWRAVLALAFVVAGAGVAGAQSREKAPKAPNQPERPLYLYLAKGHANACGPGCSEWIAVEGRFDSGSAARAIAFLQRHAVRRLPVYFHSPGGSGTEAVTLGRYLRKLGATTGVGRTVPQACGPAGQQSDACRAAKRSRQAVAADWRPDGSCNSACVFALLGGRVRHVPPPARLGVHTGKLTGVRRYSDGRVQAMTPQQLAGYKGKMAEIDAGLRRYLRDMGIDGALMDTALKVPHESVHYLSRDQIARFAIDRRDFAESPWFDVRLSNNVTLSKWIVEARGPERKDNRMSVIFLSCASGRNAAIRLVRALAGDEVGRQATVTLSIGKSKTRFGLNGAGIKLDAIDSGSLFSSDVTQVTFDELEAAASGVVSMEIDPPHLSPSHLITLSTDGLADGIKRLRTNCTPSVQPAKNANP
jgi:hypothetical protein